ncbi:MAG TPA: hypothetical protein VIO14_00735, partial [Dehalococcoidia bacterium]
MAGSQWGGSRPDATAAVRGPAMLLAGLRARAAAHLWWAGPAAVLLLVAAAHLPTLNDYFFGDDFPELAPVASTGSLDYLRDVLTFQGESRFWRLLTRVVFLAEYRAFGLDPAPYHAVNLAIHLGNVLLVYALARGLTGRTGVALVAALAFGVTPAHAVSVAWITTLNRLLHTFFFLLTLLLLRRALMGPTVRRGWLAAAAGACLLALLTDEVVVAFLPVVPAYAWLVRFGRGRDVRGLLAVTAPFAVLGAAAAAAAVLPQLGEEALAEEAYGPGPHVLRNLALYLARLAVPAVPVRPDALGPFPAAVALGVAGLGAYVLVRGPAAARFLAAWCLLALLPFTLWEDLPAPRYLYLASVPFLTGLAWLGGEAVRRAERALGPPALPAAAGVLAALFLILAWRTAVENGGQAFAAERYRVLVTGLRQALPAPEPGSTIYITNGVWTDRWDNSEWLPDVA